MEAIIILCAFGLASLVRWLFGDDDQPDIVGSHLTDMDMDVRPAVCEHPIDCWDCFGCECVDCTGKCTCQPGPARESSSELMGARTWGIGG